jgi:TonB family protein
METVVSTQVEPELHLLTTWGEDGADQRRRKAAIGTFLFHIAGIVVLFLLPESWFENKPLPEPPQRHITPIFEPLTRLTQKAPNPTKATQDFSDADRGIRGRVTVPGPPPSPAPAPTHVAAPPPLPKPVRNAEIPPIVPPKVTANPQPSPEPPKVDSALNTPKIENPQLGTIPMPPPKIQAESPRSPFQNLPSGSSPVVPPDQRKVQIPDTSVAGAINRSLAGGQPRPATPPPGTDINQALQLPQLLTDTHGVDFTSYLRIILQTVRRNWQAVIPESVRMGARGKVGVVLSIKRDGALGKVVIADSSGFNPLDQAAISGISMSQPFPPLPNEFKGDEIRVQFNFAYNAPKQ